MSARFARPVLARLLYAARTSGRPAHAAVAVFPNAGREQWYSAGARVTGEGARPVRKRQRVREEPAGRRCGGARFRGCFGSGGAPVGSTRMAVRHLVLRVTSKSRRQVEVRADGFTQERSAILSIALAKSARPRALKSGSRSPWATGVSRAPTRTKAAGGGRSGGRSRRRLAVPPGQADRSGTDRARS